MSNENKKGFGAAAKGVAKKAWGRLTYRPFWREYGYLALCAFIPAILIYLMYLARGHHPFGDGCVLVLDLNGQYVWFFEALRNFVHGDADLLYSFARQLGGEFLGIYAYYLASPLSFLVALFPKERMLEALTALFMLKGALCGATFGFYMHKTMKKPHKLSIIIFSASYALCTYAIIQQHNTMWIDAMMLLPLITLGIESIIKHGKFKLYVVSLAVAVFSNYYIGYMICIYCAIYFFIYYFANNEKFRNNPMREKCHFLRSLGRIVGYSLLALGIAAVIILGAYYSLNFGKTTFSDPFASSSWESFGVKFDLMDFLYKLLPGSYDTVRPEGLPFVYCGILTLLLIPSYFLSKKYSMREKIFSGVLLFVLFASFSLNIIDLAWHGFQKPNWLNYRYSFMFSFYLCVLACRAMADFENISLRVTMGTGGLIALFCVIMQTRDNGEYIQPDDLGCIYFSLIMIFTYLAVLAIMRKRNQQQVASFALVCIVILELFVNSLLSFNGLVEDVGCSTYSRYNNFLKDVRPVVENVQEKDDSFYRMEKTFYRSNNDNMALMIRGLSGSTSTLNKETIRFLNSLGYASKAHWTKYLGNTPVTDSLLGIKYLISEDELYENYYEVFATDPAGKYITYLNPYALSLGYGVSDDLLDFELGFVQETEDDEDDAATDEEKDGEGIKNAINSLKATVNEWMNIEENNASVYVDDYENPFDRLNAILAAMLGEEEPIEVFIPITSTISNTNNVNKQNYAQNEVGYKPTSTDAKNPGITMKANPLPASAEIFFYAPTDYPREVKLSLTVDGGKVTDMGTFNGNDTARIISLGMQEEGARLSLKLTLTGKDYYIKGGADCFWYIDIAVYEDVMTRLGKNQFQIEEYTEHSFEGTYTASRADDLVLTTLAYDNGWQVWVDGEQVEVTKALGALIAFRVGGEAGETHDIRIVYAPKCINIGLIVSIISLCLFILLIILDHFFHFGCKRRDDVDYDDGLDKDEELDMIEEEVTVEEPMEDGAALIWIKSVWANLKIIFIPPKREKTEQQHSKKKKK